MERTAAALRAASPVERQLFLSSLTDEESALLLYEWAFWARENQITPGGDWTHWLLLAGRGFGKTRTGAEWVRDRAEQGGYNERIALVAPTASDARDVMIEGESGIMNVCPPWNKPIYIPSKRKLTWANGATAHVYSAERPERLRGPQHSSAWCFIAGTKVETDQGEIDVEKLNVGDKVLTRKGYNKISHRSVRNKPVGTVSFSNGVSLTGTSDHPVLTSHGWTIMSDLSKGDKVCAINVLNGAVKNGTAIVKDITNTEEPALKVEKIEIGFIEQYTEKLMEKFHKDLMSIIRMKISITTILKTFNAFLMQNIADFIVLKTQFRNLIGQIKSYLRLPVLIAEPMFLGNLKPKVVQFAKNAAQDEQKKEEKHQENANIAAMNSSADQETIAVSVVSTWEPDGRADVYNIKVADVPEYYANGILTHNCDELCAWQYQEKTWDNLMFGLRLGRKPRTCITTTPKPTKVLLDIIKSSRTHITKGTTYDNLENLASTFRDEIISKYEGTRLGRQELLAEILEDVLGALWNRTEIEKNRKSRVPDLVRIVVSIDPPITSGDNADECGIIVAGIDDEKRGHVLADLSSQGKTPLEWCRDAVKAYHEWEADRIVAEVNQGGEMIETLLRQVDKTISYKSVHASRGKVIRAEPIAALYEQNKISHVGTFQDLEDQMCQFTLDFDKKTMGYSPDRVDSLVWAFTELMLEQLIEPNIRVL